MAKVNLETVVNELPEMDEVQYTAKGRQELFDQFDSNRKKQNLVTNKYGETFKKVALKSLKKGDEFKRKPDAKYNFIKSHYNRANQFDKTATYTCISENDALGGGIYINAKAFVYIDSEGALNYNSKSWYGDLF